MKYLRGINPTKLGRIKLFAALLGLGLSGLATLSIVGTSFYSIDRVFDQDRRALTIGDIGHSPLHFGVVVGYPDRLKINTTKRFTLTIIPLIMKDDYEFYEMGGWGYYAYFDNIKIKLSSPSFDINDDMRQVPIKPYTKLTWLITPKRSGQHMIQLDLTDIINVNAKLLGYHSTDDYITIYNRNNREKTYNSSGVIDIDIEVVTMWGLRDITLEVIRIVIFFLGFLLMYPQVQDFLRSRFKKQNGNSTSA